MRGNIDERGRKLFIGGLHLKTTEESLKAFYSQWGDLIDVVVMRDPQSGKSRGFGFVTYNDPASIDLAQGNRPHEIDGIKVDAKRAMPKEDTSPEFHATVNRLFVGRLKRDLTAEDLKQYFSEFGTIADAVIINSPAGESRGFGFVTFEDSDSVDKIIVSRPHQLDGQTVEVKKALPRDAENKGSSRQGGQGNSSRGSGRGGFSSGPFNSRSQDGPSKPSFGNYPNGNGNRNAYNSSAPHSQHYNAPYKSSNNAGYDDQYDGGYGNQPPMYNNQLPSYNNQPNYASSNINQSSYGNQASYGTPASYGTQSPYGNQPSYDAEPMYGNEASTGAMYNNQPSYKNEPSYKTEPEFDYGTYNAPVAQPNRQYGYPPQAGGGPMGDFGKKPAGGPIRGGGAGFRGGQARYNSQPY